MPRNAPGSLSTPAAAPLPHKTQWRKVSRDELLCHLLSRAAPLRHYIAQRMTAKLRRCCTVEDVMQEVCIEAVRNLETYRHASERCFDSWLYFLADRTLVRLLRGAHALKRGGAHDIEQLETAAAVGAAGRPTAGRSQPTPSSESALHEASQALHVALADMPTRYREVLRLRYFRGLSARHIAGLMGMTAGNVNRLLERAERMLRVRLGGPEKYLSDA